MLACKVITPDLIKLVSVESGDVEDLTDLGDRSHDNYATMAWSPNGRYLYYRKANHEKKRGEIWFVDVETKEAQYTGVAVPFLRYLSVNPNGEQLVFTDYSFGTHTGTAWVMKNFMPD